jgi:predicted permease
MNDLVETLFRSIVPIFVLTMFGLGLRRLGVVGEKGTDGLSRWVIRFFFPMLVFYRLATTENPMMIVTDWMIHVWSVVVLIGSGIIGLCWHRLVRTKADVRIFVFMIGMPNWIYLPLALAGPIWGDEAVRLLILFNIPTTVILWTLGIWVLHGTLRGAHVLKYMLLNPGVISTVAGLLVAFGVIPISFQADGGGLSLARVSPVLHFIGGLTVPLSLVALGLYLGEKGEGREGAKREVVLVTIGRLIIAPLIIGSIVIGVTALGVESSLLSRAIIYLIVSMPVAVSAPMFAQMFGRDRYLASRGVVFTTMIGFFTAPLFVYLALNVEVWLGLVDSLHMP